MASNQHDTDHHEHGTMDIRQSERTFAGFISWMTWSFVATAVVLIFLALVGA